MKVRTGRRSFLFLQGGGTLFFARLARALAEHGHRVNRINFCRGDELFWPDLPSWSYTEPHEAFDEFFEDCLLRAEATDLLFLGDCRPLHRVAAERAKRHGVAIHVFEHGYLRPNWITMEEGGINGYSRMPRDPDWYRSTAPSVPDYRDGLPVGDGTRERIIDDIRFQLSNVFSRRYPHFRTHRPYHILAEYRTWAQRLSTLPLRMKQADRIIASLIRDRTPYYLHALQLDTDTQIRVHSTFGGMMPAVETTLRSFAAHAPAETLLVIKNHPLDNGMINYRREVRRLATAFGIGDRVVYIDGGHLPDLVRHALGVVMVNSTVGMSSLFHGRPTHVLGAAVYKISGLTHSGTLDAFWRDTPRPDPLLFKAFRNCLIHFTQLNGNFYTDIGQALGVDWALRRLGGGRWVPGGPTAAPAPLSVPSLTEGS